MPLLNLTVTAACVALATSASAQSARDTRGASRGLVFIQYRTENLRVAPVLGQGALNVSPRIGHVHLSVDGLPWHFVDASGETVILVGLPPGLHSVLFELADPTHKVIAHETVRFTVPELKADKPPSN
ncbi:MAG: hypothetical protein JOY66_14580 [Acetobacteraceae bacterium]|nr:hypothetical protein [Acetobacteraceae bacterium]